jgi:hypothetical protein
MLALTNHAKAGLLKGSYCPLVTDPGDARHGGLCQDFDLPDVGTT